LEFQLVRNQQLVLNGDISLVKIQLQILRIHSLEMNKSWNGLPYSRVTGTGVFCLAVLVQSSQINDYWDVIN